MLDRRRQRSEVRGHPSEQEEEDVKKTRKRRSRSVESWRSGRGAPEEKSFDEKEYRKEKNREWRESRQQRVGRVEKGGEAEMKQEGRARLVDLLECELVCVGCLQVISKYTMFTLV